MHSCTEQSVHIPAPAAHQFHHGLPIWHGVLEFMPRLTHLQDRCDEVDPDLTTGELLQAFHEVAEEVRRKVPQAQARVFAPEDEDLEHFVVTLEGWTAVTIDDSPDIFAEFRELLDRLDDWCDANRWWIRPN